MITHNCFKSTVSFFQIGQNKGKLKPNFSSPYTIAIATLLLYQSENNPDQPNKVLTDKTIRTSPYNILDRIRNKWIYVISINGNTIAFESKLFKIYKPTKVFCSKWPWLCKMTLKFIDWFCLLTLSTKYRFL